MTNKTECNCSLSIRLCGDGCKKCQPETYIFNLENELQTAEQEVEQLRSENESLKKENAEMKDAIEHLGNVSDICTKRYTKNVCANCKCQERKMENEMGQAKQRGSREQRVAEAMEREAAQRLAYQKVLSMRESPKRSAAKAMMMIAMIQAVVGGTRS